MTGTSVAASRGALPELASTPALDLGADDIVLPRLYIGQFMSDHVQQQLVKPGSLFLAAGSEDPDPQVLWELDEKSKLKDDVVLHVLSLRRAKSFSEGGELQRYDYDDPAAPEGAWVTYNYMIALPAVSDEVPAKLLLTRTGKPAAQQINTILKKNESRGPAWQSAFKLTTAVRENPKGKFFVPRIGIATATAEGTAIAESLASQLGTRPESQFQASGEEPAI